MKTRHDGPRPRSANAAESGAQKRRSTTYDRARGLARLFALLLAAAFALRCYGLSFNVTDSMPIGFYHVEGLTSPVARGTIVQACLPATVAALGRRQGYLLPGSCPDGAAPVLKIVAGIGGDVVQCSRGRVLVNGNVLRGSASAPRDERGRPLARLEPRTLTLAPGELWLWTPNPASWDSRYYGPIPEKRVLGRATLLFSFVSWRFAGTRL